MKITIHRGKDQIGGCITEIESKSGSRIIIDLGHNLPKGDKESKDEYASDEAVAKLTEGVSGIFYTHNPETMSNCFNSSRKERINISAHSR